MDNHMRNNSYCFVLQCHSKGSRVGFHKTCSEPAVFKCRKCRHILFTDVNVVSSHSEPYQADSITHGLSCDSKSIERVWFLQEENVTDWMKEQLNNGDWIKGKLSCPKCCGRIGSFDFISGSQCPCRQMVLPSLHVVRSKVDCEPIKLKSSATDASPVCLKPGLSCTGKDSFDLPEKDWKEDGGHDFDKDSISTGLPENDEFIEIKTKLRKQKQPGEKCVLTRKNTCVLSGCCSSGTESPETTQFENFSNLVCPICLDLYLSPFTCQPCGHVFCEVCLRKIAKSKPTHTYCPICRQLIGRCELNREISQAVKSQHPNEYKARLREEDKDCRCFPLPWNSKYHPGMPSFGLESDPDQIPRASWWALFSAQQQTFAILLSLKIISAIMFFLGFFGGSYVTSILKYLASFAPQVFQEILETSIRSNDTED